MQTIPNKKENTRLGCLRQLSKQQSAGLVFTASSLLLLLFSFLFVVTLAVCGVQVGEVKPDWYLYVSSVLPQLVFLAVALLAFCVAKIPVKEVAGKPSIKYFVLALVLQFGLQSLSELNGYFVEFLEGFGYQPTAVMIPSTEGVGLVFVLFCVALLPAVFEEIIFRGLVLRGLKGFGTVACVLLSGALFSLYHQNPVQTAYQFCCGVAFALIALRSGSVFPTMLAHFCNNAAIILIYHFTGVDELVLPWQITLIAALCLVGTLGYLFFFDKKQDTEEKTDKKGFFTYAAIGLVVCAVNWISALFA